MALWMEFLMVLMMGSRLVVPLVVMSDSLQVVMKVVSWVG